MNAPCYVILQHRDRAGEHWDFMIEQDTALATWKLEADPTGADALPVRGARIQDHRKRYLDYEGPISRDRGHVIRVDRGRCDLSACDPEEWRFELRDGRLRGSFRLVRTDPERNLWTLTTA
jgi:hypothetical protein